MGIYSLGRCVADQLSQAMGKRVVLHYKEYRYLPTTCFGDTPYFVDRIASSLHKSEPSSSQRLGAGEKAGPCYTASVSS